MADGPSARETEIARLLRAEQVLTTISELRAAVNDLAQKVAALSDALGDADWRETHASGSIIDLTTDEASRDPRTI
jgi:hypothetical protein